MARRRELSNKYYEAGSTYLQLVKSRIIGALVTEEERLLSDGGSRDHDFSLLLALCAYFAARTDYELEQRGMNEDVRDDVWIGVIESVFEEMGIAQEVGTVARDFILGQMELVRGVINTKGAADYESVARTLEVLSSSAEEIVGDTPSYKLSIDSVRIKELLEKYDDYCSFLDDMVAES